MVVVVAVETVIESVEVEALQVSILGTMAVVAAVRAAQVVQRVTNIYLHPHQ